MCFNLHNGHNKDPTLIKIQRNVSVQFPSLRVPDLYVTDQINLLSNLIFWPGYVQIAIKMKCLLQALFIFMNLEITILESPYSERKKRSDRGSLFHLGREICSSLGRLSLNYDG